MGEEVDVGSEHGVPERGVRDVGEVSSAVAAPNRGSKSCYKKGRRLGQ